jgi:hypothetical protein
MRNGSPTRARLAAALLAVAVVAPGCGRPPDEAWLRFLGFKSGDSTLTVLEGNLNDGKTDSADAVFRNVSVTVGASDGGAGTGILVKSARVDYKMSGYSPPSAEYPLNLYLGPSSHTNGTATSSGGETEGRTSLPLATASLKQWLINAHAAGSSPTVSLTADVTFLAESDEGGDLEVHGSVTILLSTSGSGSSTATPSVSISATTSTATTAAPGKFTITRSGGTTNSLTVAYDVTGTATAGSDYEAFENSVTINAGSSVASITVTPLIGATTGRTVIVTLQESSSYTVVSPSSATVTITN